MSSEGTSTSVVIAEEASRLHPLFVLRIGQGWYSESLIKGWTWPWPFRDFTIGLRKILGSDWKAHTSWDLERGTSVSESGK